MSRQRMGGGDGAGTYVGKKMGELQLTREEGVKMLLFFAGVLLLISLAVLGAARLAGHAGGAAGCGIYPFLSQQESCIYARANSTENLSMCRQLPYSQKSSCVYAIALRERNISACGQLNASGEPYYQCVLRLVPESGDYNYCAALPQPEGLFCIYNASSLSNFTDEGRCNAITNSTYRAQCSSLYYFEEAQIRNNASYCGMLGQRSNQTIMYALTLPYRQGGNASIAMSSLFSEQMNASPMQYCDYRVGECKYSYSQSGGLSC